MNWQDYHRVFVCEVVLEDFKVYQPNQETIDLYMAAQTDEPPEPLVE